MLDKRKKLLVTALGAAIVLGAIVMVMRDGKESNPSRERTSMIMDGRETRGEQMWKGRGVPITSEKKNERIPPLKVSWRAWQRNPFIPANRPLVERSRGEGKEGGGKSSVRLEGIILGGKRPMAIINGKSVKKGGSVGQWKVVSVKRHSVTLRSQGREWELKLVAPRRGEIK